MSKAFRYLFSAVVIMTLLLGSMAMAPAARSDASVHLKSGSFIPAQSNPAAGSQKYYIVQLAGPVQQAWKDALAAEGAEILYYLPDFAFKVRMNPSIASRVAKLNFVSGVTAYRPEFKFGSSLTRDGQVRLYRVRIERGADFGLVRSLVAQSGAQVVGFDNDILVVAANSALVDALAQVDDVASISNFVMYETFAAPAAPKSNDYAVTNIIGAAAAHARGYNGSTQIVGVADTGLGGGTPTTAHRDINGRVAAIYNWRGVDDSCWTITDDGAVDVDSGHGTHTAGSVLSAGAPNGIGKGSAPAAQLVFQAVENWATMKGICALYYPNGYYLTGLPSDLNQLYQQAYNAGARIHSNSWGSAAAGDYTVESVQSDTFIWNNRDMLITFSAGNEGTDANSDGVIDSDSMGSPATAKNVLTVGASENQRSDGYPCDTSLSYTACASQGGVNNIFTWGAAWPSDYPANPIKDDVSANNAGQMAAFSSRGPTDDNRIKPDVVAPGSWILSTYSDMYQQGYDASPNPKNNAWQYDGYGFPYDQYYKYLSGTSMSNPLTAGGAAVVKDYYNKAYSVNATAALVKATLINSAVDMLDENNDGVNDNDFPIPNVHEGWGRINLDAATDGTIQFVDEGTGLSTGGSAAFSVTTTGGPLKVTLVWTDYPSTDTAAINLVNDLDLTVSGPSGAFLGNVFSGGWSATGGSADRRNNVENVYIQNPAAGTYTITVSGFNIPNGPQKFALVVDGGTLGSAPTPTPAPTSTPTSTPAPTTSTGYLSPSANAAVTSGSGDNNGYESSPANAYANDGAVATDLNSGTGTSTTYTSTQKDRHVFYNYGFSIPSGATITGIEVRVDARADKASGTRQIYVQFSWDGGVTWTTALSTPNLGTSEATYILGGTTNTWGRTWSASDFSNANFRVRVIDVSSNNARDFYLDWIAVNVTYQP
ncbi:MAG: S8 family serine peptidase [Chloroflexota bacterium]|nr:S8 family serine peptidase [Chloroflexota bacterium]MBI5703199.1 S8 family serine peptidase [Chloroflexota bacterium]